MYLLFSLDVARTPDVEVGAVGGPTLGMWDRASGCGHELLECL